MRLSVLAAQKSHSRLLPQNGFHGDPHVPGGGHRWGFRPGRRGLSETDFASWDPRFGAGLRGEEWPRWGRNGGARRPGMVQGPQQSARGGRRLPSPGSKPPSPPAPSAKPALQVPGGRGPRRPGAGGPCGGSGSVAMPRAAAAGGARLDLEAGGAAQLPRTHRAARAATARGPRPGRGAGKHASIPAS